MRTQHLDADPPKSLKKAGLTRFQEVCPQLLKPRLRAKFGGIFGGLGERMKTRRRLKNRQVNKTVRGLVLESTKEYALELIKD